MKRSTALPPFDQLLPALRGRLANRRRLPTNRLDDRDIHRLLHSIDDRLERLEYRVGGNGLGGKLRHIELEVQAVQRHLRLRDAEWLGPSERLIASRFKGLSQNEEDGITLAIMEALGIDRGRFVELGCGSNGGNSGYLARELNWSGFMVDTQEELVARARQVNPATVTAVTSWITRDSVDDLLSSHGFNGEIDLLSIDIDGNDWWVWERLSAIDPRVVITEYNSIFGGERAVVVPYAEEFDRHAIKDLQRVYYGASLRAFEVLARRKGYRLVAVEPRGVNAFWVRDDLARDDLPRLEARAAFRMLEKHQSQLKRTGEVFALLERRGLPLVDVEA